MGWVATMTRLSWSPESATPANAAISPQRPNFSDDRIMSTFCLRSRCQAEIETMTPAVIMKAANRVCGRAASATGLVSTARKSVISAREPSSAILKPTGFCMKAFAARMKYAENHAPIVAIQMLARWSALGSLSQPKIHRPMKVASKKNAIRPSKASGAPKTSPTKRE